MKALGIDLASRAEATSAAVVADGDRGPQLVELVSGADDERLVELSASVAAVGIDAPLAWPVAFVDTIRRHHLGEVVQAPGDRRDLQLRLTDRLTHERVGHPPLSVSTDRIGVVALRAITLLPRLAHAQRRTPIGERPAIDGTDAIIEAYPAGALASWGRRSRGYKRGAQAPERRRDIVDWLSTGIDLGEEGDRLVDSHDDLDAVLAALVTVWFSRGLTVEPTETERRSAAQEGWIHLPASAFTT